MSSFELGLAVLGQLLEECGLSGGLPVLATQKTILAPIRILATEFAEIFEIGLKFSIFSLSSVAFSDRFLSYIVISESSVPY